MRRVAELGALRQLRTYGTPKINSDEANSRRRFVCISGDSRVSRVACAVPILSRQQREHERQLRASGADRRLQRGLLFGALQQELLLVVSRRRRHGKVKRMARLTSPNNALRI
jgi:hypothetical protein